MSYYYNVSSEKWVDSNACNNVRDILYNTDVITSLVNLIIHSPVGKLLVYHHNLLIYPCCCCCPIYVVTRLLVVAFLCVSNITLLRTDKIKILTDIDLFRRLTL